MYSTVHILRTIIYEATARGASLQKLCGALDLHPSDLADAERRIVGVDPVIRLWTEIGRALNDDLAGLHIGEQCTPAVMGIVGYVMQNSPNLEAALHTLTDSQRLLSGWVSYGLEKGGQEFNFYFSVHPIWQNVSPETARQAVQMPMAGTLHIARLLTGKKLQPLRTYLSGPRLGPLAEYERIFQSPVYFEQEGDYFVFSAEQLEYPVLSFDQSLFALFGQLLNARAAGNREVTFVEQVRGVLMRDFKGQTPPVEVISAHMHLSKRSFQRKLTVEGSSYRLVCGELKKELAVKMLKSTNAKVNVIADVLGYAEPSTFRKAFKSWTNTTPSVLKKSAVEA